jgi:hypothetical protein
LLVHFKEKEIHSERMKILTFFIVLCFWKSLVWAQAPGQLKNRVDLEDVNIKGEVNKNNLSFTNRSRHNLNDRIRLRKDFTKEILENIPEEFTPNRER